jgi:hypothetical protein
MSSQWCDLSCHEGTSGEVESVARLKKESREQFEVESAIFSFEFSTHFES